MPWSWRWVGICKVYVDRYCRVGGWGFSHFAGLLGLLRWEMGVRMMKESTRFFRGTVALRSYEMRPRICAFRCVLRCAFRQEGKPVRQRARQIVAHAPHIK